MVRMHLLISPHASPFTCTFKLHITQLRLADIHVLLSNRLLRSLAIEDTEDFPNCPSAFLCVYKGF